MKRKYSSPFGAVTALIILAASGISLGQQPLNPKRAHEPLKPPVEDNEKTKPSGTPTGTVVTPPPPPAPTQRPAPPTSQTDPEKEAAPKSPNGGPNQEVMPSVDGNKSTATPGHHFKPNIRDLVDKDAPEAAPKAPAQGRPADPEKESATKPDAGQATNLDAAIKRKFDVLKDKEVNFEDYRKAEIAETARLEQLKSNSAKKFAAISNASSSQTACGNGDFESGLDLNQWSGGYGSVMGNGTIDYAHFTTGILQGAINLGTSRQTLTNQGIDPIVGIQQTGPAAPNYVTGVRSQHAVRIGNAYQFCGAELLSKTFTVSSADANLRFWYAVVMENPGHSPVEQPTFEVRVLDGNGAPIPGLVDLGNGSGKIIASTDPFLQQKTGTSIVYRDWSCVQVNLSSQVGKKVTMQFVTRDCSLSGHWGYAYIDNICGKCGIDNPTGDIEFNAAQSSKCGLGKLCFDLTLGKDSQGTTGTAIINLDIYQNGNKVTTLTSPSITSGNSYCFSINPASITGLNPALGGFDYTATGKFTLGSSTTTLTVGNPPDGQVAGNNNDYKIACEPCCDGKNLVINGEFDAKDEQPRSSYKPIHLREKEKLVPGTFAITEADAISKACPNWRLPETCLKTKDFSGGVMLVNGLTNQPSGQTGAIIDQKIELPKSPGGRKVEYSICFRYLPLPACCFDVTPKLSVVVQDPKGAAIALSNVKDIPTGCGQFYSAKFTANTPGMVNLQILLAEDGRGDGNDLMIDNVAIRECSPEPRGVKTNVDGIHVLDPGP